jgi:hypothetical protein
MVRAGCRAAVDDESVGVAAEAVAGSAAGRASAAAQVTPIEDARNRDLRMRPILDIVIHICPSRN